MTTPDKRYTYGSLLWNYSYNQLSRDNFIKVAFHLNASNVPQQIYYRK